MATGLFLDGSGKPHLLTVLCPKCSLLWIGSGARTSIPRLENPAVIQRENSPPWCLCRRTAPRGLTALSSPWYHQPCWLWLCWLLPFKARHCSCCDPYRAWFACAPCSWIWILGGFPCSLKAEPCCPCEGLFSPAHYPALAGKADATPSSSLFQWSVRRIWTAPLWPCTARRSTASPAMGRSTAPRATATGRGQGP